MTGLLEQSTYRIVVDGPRGECGVRATRDCGAAGAATFAFRVDADTRGAHVAPTTVRSPRNLGPMSKATNAQITRSVTKIAPGNSTPSVVK